MSMKTRRPRSVPGAQAPVTADYPTASQEAARTDRATKNGWQQLWSFACNTVRAYLHNLGSAILRRGVLYNGVRDLRVLHTVRLRNNVYVNQRVPQTISHCSVDVQTTWCKRLGANLVVQVMRRKLRGAI